MIAMPVGGVQLASADTHHFAGLAVQSVRSEAAPRPPNPRRGLRRAPWAIVGAVSFGGIVGSLTRHAITTFFPYSPRGFPWATFGINASGCFLIGVVMVLTTEVWRVHRLVRPFLGIGVLGGFTTFSTYVVDAQHAITVGARALAFAYLAGTLAAAMVAVLTGVQLTRLATRTRSEARERGHGTRPRSKATA